MALVMLAMHHHSVGDPKTALGFLRGAFALAPKSAQSTALDAMSSCYRTERDFSAGALAMELATLLRPEVEELTGLAIMYKNANRLDDAIRVLRVAVVKNPEDWNLRLILAGYLIRAGKTQEGWRLYATVKEPRDDKAPYHMNMAWFHASVGKKKEFLDHLSKVLELSTTAQILTYITTEVDFDRYRSDPDFQALIARHRQRLLAPQTEPPPPPAEPKALK
jgi:tetratricopeptide (TPR) repeat protein